MPNRSCDFCENGYRNKPEVGYYSVTENMRISLNINRLEEDSCFDYICGEHFSVDCFDVNGRLICNSIPTFFPYRECLHHDHTYVASNDEVIGKDTGKRWVKGEWNIYKLLVQAKCVGSTWALQA